MTEILMLKEKFKKINKINICLIYVNHKSIKIKQENIRCNNY